MKTEVFKNMTPTITTEVKKVPKSLGDSSTFLLMDTSQNTPVSTSGSDFFSGDDNNDTSGSSPEKTTPLFGTKRDSLIKYQSLCDEIGLDSGEEILGSYASSPDAGTNLVTLDDSIPECSKDDSISSELQRTAPVDIRQPKDAYGRRRRRHRKKPLSSFSEKFFDYYTLKDDLLGEGSCAKVRTCIDKRSGKEYAVKIIRNEDTARIKVFKEIEIFHFCQGHENIIQLVRFFEEDDNFYIVFEKGHGGPLLNHLLKKRYFTEKEASMIIRDIANALKFLHQKGIAHRDLKLENILCFSEEQTCPVKICDFDLGSSVLVGKKTPCSTPELQSPVGSAEFMAPEVVAGFQGEDTHYDKRCDLWSLGVVMYIILCGYNPFYGACGTECGWSKGESCSTCQDKLFDCIKNGVYEFPESEWADISDDAKDLINHLLVKDAMQRYSAEMVLNHPWVANGGPDTALKTPSVIRRNNSLKELAAFTNSANAMKRQYMHSVYSAGSRPCTVVEEGSSPGSARVSSPDLTLLSIQESVFFKRRVADSHAKSLEF